MLTSIDKNSYDDATAESISLSVSVLAVVLDIMCHRQRCDQLVYCSLLYSYDRLIIVGSDS